jgi:hypothetical protein
MVAAGVAVTVTVTCGVTVWVAGALEGTPDSGLVPPSEADAVTVVVAVAEMVTGGELGTVGVDDEPVQAETATGTSRVRAPQPRAVSLAANVLLATVMRTFMGPPHARLMSSLFPGEGPRNRYRNGKRAADLVVIPRRRGQDPEIIGH